MKNVDVKKERNPLFHIERKQEQSLLTKWLIRLSAIITGFLFISIISSFLGGSIKDFFVRIFDACFVNLATGGLSSVKILDLLENTAILLLIALALIPAFKMKFWNIGAEGQIIMGILMCAIMQKYVGQNMPLENVAVRIIYFVLLFIACIAAGALWGFIPAFFKAKFKTNETLFTLMMNYIALLLTKVVINIWDPIKADIQAFGELTYLPKIGSAQVGINLIIITIVAILIFVYLKFSKHGYEINVVGGSRNTARYVGININKVTIRTLILSGGLCGLCGCLLLAGEHNNLTATIVSGRGFTGVMIAWLSGFGAVEVTLYSFLCAFVLKGSRSVNYNSAFPNIMLSLFFFTLIAFEFFVNYSIRSEKIETFIYKKFPKLKKKKKEQEIDLNPAQLASNKKEGK